MIELSKSDSSSIKNPSKYDLQKALAELMDHKHDFIILNVDSSSFIQAICNNRCYNIEYRIGEDDLVSVKKTFNLNEATDLLESFRVRDFKSVFQRTNLKSNKSEINNHIRWRDKKNSGKLSVLNIIYNVSKGVVPFQIVFCLVLIVDLFILESVDKTYSVVSMKTEYGALGFTRGLKVIAPDYARSYYLIYARNESKQVRVSVSNSFGKDFTPGNQIVLRSSNLFGINKGVGYAESGVIQKYDYRNRNVFIIYILSISLTGLILLKYGRKINLKEYEESKRWDNFYEASSFVRYVPTIYILSTIYFLIHIFTQNQSY